MSGVYIKGMEMPKNHNHVTITIWPNGDASYSLHDRGESLVDFRNVEVVPIPPNGDLIGREWLIDIALHLMHTSKNDDIANGVKWLLQYIIEAPTIISASKEDE